MKILQVRSAVPAKFNSKILKTGTVEQSATAIFPTK